MVATDATAELLELFTVSVKLIAGGGGGKIIKSVDDITVCNTFEEFCCRFENIFDSLVNVPINTKSVPSLSKNIYRVCNILKKTNN